MAREWIDEGLRHAQEREEEQRAAAERRLRQTAAIKEKGPDLMRRLIAETVGVVEEFRQKAGDASEVQVEILPREAFFISKSTLPSVGLECRPDYEAHVVYCNMTRTDDKESDVVESVFTLNFNVDASENVQLRHEAQPFRTVEEAVEFLLRPVLFPLFHQHL